MNEQELNKKLAKYFNVPVEDYTQSLDACKEQLFPKLRHICLETFYKPDGSYEWMASVKKDARSKKVTVVFNDSPTLAFCLATEKLIDSGKSK